MDLYKLAPVGTKLVPTLYQGYKIASRFALSWYQLQRLVCGNAPQTRAAQTYENSMEIWRSCKNIYDLECFACNTPLPPWVPHACCWVPLGLQMLLDTSRYLLPNVVPQMHTSCKDWRIEMPTRMHPNMKVVWKWYDKKWGAYRAINNLCFELSPPLSGSIRNYMDLRCLCGCIWIYRGLRLDPYWLN